ncbi:MAG: sigma-70 family RNA polymerase sigma factor [Lachnospiraceae bacterium]|nr:sigma-70 family RNA polymerase sigma factor [Lachnospiraceae bacterium]
MIDKYQDLILTICYRMTGDYFAAQDLTQETFLTAYRFIDKLEEGHEKGWLAKTASNKCIDYLRKAGHAAVAVEPESLYEIEAPKGTEDVILEKDLRAGLKESCEKLKKPYNEVAYRYFYLEQTPEEIASFMNERLATVKTRIYRARDKLRKIYRSEQVERRQRDG